MISDELVEKAYEAQIPGENGRRVQDYVDTGIVRAALEAVIPDIEQPLREEIHRLEYANDYMRDSHENDVAEWEAKLAISRSRSERLEADAKNGAKVLLAQVDWRKGLEAQLAERDQEIERLKAEVAAEIRERVAYAYDSDRAYGAKLAERDEEISRLQRELWGGA